MKSWENRPIEEANLLNPAFCGELLRHAMKQYNMYAEQPFPYPLIFLILPVVLHRYTREAIPPNTREQFHVWLQNNQSVRVGFAERTKNLVPFTKEALNFLLQLNIVTINKTAGLELKRNPRPIDRQQGDTEIKDCFRKAEIVGRWYARAGNTANVYTMWGVKP